jgi:RHS repeat-associated protein
MEMPGKIYVAGYRYGFNGKEKDNELKGSGNSLDYGARFYDPRLGKWFSADPLRQLYAALSPYHFGANDPVNIMDADGNILRDKDGNIIATDNGKTTERTLRTVSGVSYVVKYKEITIYTDKGKPVQAQIATDFVARTTVKGKTTETKISAVELRTQLGKSNATSESVKSNCHGYVFADNNILIGDGRKKILDDEYKFIGVVNDDKPNAALEAKADVVVIYGVSGVVTSHQNMNEDFWYHTGGKEEDGDWTDKDDWTKARDNLKTTANVRDSHLEMHKDDDKDRVLYTRKNEEDKRVKSLKTIKKPANGIRLITPAELKKVKEELKKG